MVESHVLPKSAGRSIKLTSIHKFLHDCYRGVSRMRIDEIWFDGTPQKPRNYWMSPILQYEFRSS